MFFLNPRLFLYRWTHFIFSDEADRQIKGVPNEFRQKKHSRVEALAFYRHRYETNRVHKMVPVPVDTGAAAAPAATAPAVPAAA